MSKNVIYELRICTNPQSEILLEYQSRTDPIPDFWSGLLSESLFNNMSTKNDILTFTLPCGGERGRTDDLLNANQAL